MFPSLAVDDSRGCGPADVVEPGDVGFGFPGGGKGAYVNDVGFAELGCTTTPPFHHVPNVVSGCSGDEVIGVVTGRVVATVTDDLAARVSSIELDRQLMDVLCASINSDLAISVRLAGELPLPASRGPVSCGDVVAEPRERLAVGAFSRTWGSVLPDPFVVHVAPMAFGSGSVTSIDAACPEHGASIPRSCANG